MPDEDTAAAEQAVARFSECVRRAHEEVTAAISAIPNPQEALDPTQLFVKSAEATYNLALKLRAKLVRQIWEAEQMTATALADRLNITRQRVGQIAKAEREQKEQSP